MKEETCEDMKRRTLPPPQSSQNGFGVLDKYFYLNTKTVHSRNTSVFMFIVRFLQTSSTVTSRRKDRWWTVFCRWCALEIGGSAEPDQSWVSLSIIISCICSGRQQQRPCRVCESPSVMEGFGREIGNVENAGGGCDPDRCSWSWASTAPWTRAEKEKEERQREIFKFFQSDKMIFQTEIFWIMCKNKKVQRNDSSTHLQDVSFPSGLLLKVIDPLIILTHSSERENQSVWSKSFKIFIFSNQKSKSC